MDVLRMKQPERLEVGDYIATPSGPKLVIDLRNYDGDLYVYFGDHVMSEREIELFGPGADYVQLRDRDRFEPVAVWVSV